MRFHHTLCSEGVICWWYNLTNSMQFIWDGCEWRKKMPVTLTQKQEPKMSPHTVMSPGGQNYPTENHCSSANWILSHSGSTIQITVSVPLIIFYTVSSYFGISQLLPPHLCQLPHTVKILPVLQDDLKVHSNERPFLSHKDHVTSYGFQLCTWFASINSSNWTLFYHWGSRLISSQSDCRLL